MTPDRMQTAVDEIVQLLMTSFSGPKDAAKALVLAHATITKMENFDREAVSLMLAEYKGLFNQAYFGADN